MAQQSALADGPRTWVINAPERRASNGEPAGESKRRHARFKVHHRVDYEHDSLSGFGYATDIGKGGLFVRAPRLLPAGSELRVRMTADEGGMPALVTGRVVRVCEDPERRGMAIAFAAEPAAENPLEVFVLKAELRTRGEELEQAKRAVDTQRGAVEQEKIKLETQRLQVADEHLRHAERVRITQRALKDIEREYAERLAQWQERQRVAQAELEQARQQIEQQRSSVERDKNGLRAIEQTLQMQREKYETELERKRVELETYYKKRLEDAVREQQLVRRLTERKEEQRRKLVDHQETVLFARELEIQRRERLLDARQEELQSRAQKLEQLERERRAHFEAESQALLQRELARAAEHKEKLAALREREQQSAESFRQRLAELEQRRTERLTVQRDEEQRLRAEVGRVQERLRELERELRAVDDERAATAAAREQAERERQSALEARQAVLDERDAAHKRVVELLERLAARDVVEKHLRTTIEGLRAQHADASARADLKASMLDAVHHEVGAAGEEHAREKALLEQQCRGLRAALAGMQREMQRLRALGADRGDGGQ